MRCAYCHNPDTWHTGGKTMTAQDLWERASRYQSYWQPRGGVTLSGGEPMLQMDFCTAFFSLAKLRSVHTALDTSGQPFQETPEFLARFDALMAVTDLVLLDIKAMDDTLHRRLTGQTNQNILAMARHLSTIGKELWIRHVFVPGITGSDKELSALKRFIDSLRTVTRIEVLPYHDMGRAKWEALKMAYPLEDARPPTREEMDRAERMVGIKA